MNQQRGIRRGGCVRKSRIDEQVKSNGKDSSPGGSSRGISGRRLSRIKSDSSCNDGKKWISPELGDNPIQLRKTLSEPARMATIPGENSVETRVEDEVDIEMDVERKGVELQKEDLQPEIDVVEEEEEEEQEEEEDKRIDQIHEVEVPISSNVVMIPPDALDCQKIIDPSNIQSPPTPIMAEVADESYEEIIYEKQNKMQKNIVDLVMWREASRSALVFGAGMFFLISSSYTKDLNFSLISAISYLGLFYLATIFLYKSIIHRTRGSVDFEDIISKENLLIREEDASRLICILLPYINEVLINIRALFSGDPSTTMKMAMTLFVLARCGGSITIWTMAKLAFFGVFTIPRLLSSYSDHIHRYGKFVLDRSRDAWDSCTHKKAVAFGTFAVMWNLSSPAARTWVVFMMLVAARYYQQQMAAATESDDGENDVRSCSSKKVTVAEVN